MEHPRTTKNVGQPCVICGQPANAQATVEALQKKLVQEQALNTVRRDAWWQSVKELEAALDAEREKVKGLQAQVSELQGIADEKCRCFLERAEQSEKQLTQCTAELEAAANYYKQPSKNGGVYSVSGGHIGNLMDWCKDNLKHCKFSGPDEDNLDLDLVQTAQQIPQLKTELSQLQALVRALLNELDDATFVDSRGYRYATYKEDVVLGNLDTAIKLVRATLDATTPAPMDAAETHDRMFNHMDRHPEAL